MKKKRSKMKFYENQELASKVKTDEQARKDFEKLLKKDQKSDK